MNRNETGIKPWAEGPVRASSRRSVALHPLCSLLIALCPVLVLACLSLDSLLFAPERVRGAYLRPEDMNPAWGVRFIIPDSLIQTVELTSQGNKIYGLLVQPDGRDSANQQVTIIYSHGNGQNINRYWGRVELLWEMGFRVFIYDYQGYGMSEGRPSCSACNADAEAALEYCLSRSDVDTGNLVYYGWSLGTFTSTHLAADVRCPRGVILETPVATTRDLPAEGALLNLPDSFDVHCRFDNEATIGRVNAPLLLLAGKKDRNVNFQRNALALYDRCDRTRTEYHWLDDAGHEDIPEKMGADYARVITDFIRQSRR